MDARFRIEDKGSRERERERERKRERERESKMILAIEKAFRQR